MLLLDSEGADELRPTVNFESTTTTHQKRSQASRRTPITSERSVSTPLSLSC